MPRDKLSADAEAQVKKIVREMLGQSKGSAVTEGNVICGTKFECGGDYNCRIPFACPGEFRCGGVYKDP